MPDALLHQSTENLMHYLCPSPLSELARLRSIYRWMTSFRLEDLIKDQLSDGREAMPQSPLEQLKKISSQTTNYAAVFTQLTRLEWTAMLDVSDVASVIPNSLVLTIGIAARTCLLIGTTKGNQN